MNEITAIRTISDEDAGDLVSTEAFAELAEMITSMPATERQRHATKRSWRPFAVVFTALAIAAPAVGAVTHWYGFGAPNRPGPGLRLPDLRAAGFGKAVRGSAHVLALRVPDPQGGPPWGIMAVRVQGGTCNQVGRVENGQIGSLGIDGYWHNDQLFHHYPDSGWDSCGTSGNGGSFGVFDASANVPRFHDGVQANGCAISPRATSSRPACPQGSLRIVLQVSFGARAQSITYRNQRGALQTERSPDSDGTFLLIFPLNATTCRRYLHGQLTSDGTCNRETASSPGNPIRAAIKTVNLKNGKSISLGA